ncbi:unnamed protein product [Merluccius merluccius]
MKLRRSANKVQPTDDLNTIASNLPSSFRAIPIVIPDLERGWMWVSVGEEDAAAAATHGPVSGGLSNPRRSGEESCESESKNNGSRGQLSIWRQSPDSHKHERHADGGAELRCSVLQRWGFLRSATPARRVPA